jgi:hypothetical protein
VFKATPLAKYESYRQVLDRWHFQSEDDDDEVDLTPTVHSMVSTLLRFLKIDRSKYVVETRDDLPVRLQDVFPEVYAHEEPAFIAGMMRRYGLDAERIEQVLGHLARSGSCYIPRINAIFVGTFDLAHAGEEASHFVNSALKGELYENWHGEEVAGHDRFYGAVMEEAIGFFGSKLVDPTRNHFFETDFYRLYAKKPEEVEAQTGYKYPEFKAIIDFILLHKKLEKDYRQRRDVPPEILAGLGSTGGRFRTLTHELGYFLGQQIYDGFHRGLVSHDEIVGLYQSRWDQPASAVSAYLDWAERLAALTAG